MLIALHACDIATDIAIAKGVSNRSRDYYRSALLPQAGQKQMACHTGMHTILRHGILEERQAELITDGIRSLMDTNGYQNQSIRIHFH